MLRTDHHTSRTAGASANKPGSHTAFANSAPGRVPEIETHYQPAVKRGHQLLILLSESYGGWHPRAAKHAHDLSRKAKGKGFTPHAPWSARSFLAQLKQQCSIAIKDTTAESIMARAAEERDQAALRARRPSPRQNSKAGPAAESPSPPPPPKRSRPPPPPHTAYTEPPAALGTGVGGDDRAASREAALSRARDLPTATLHAHGVPVVYTRTVPRRRHTPRGLDRDVDAVARTLVRCTTAGCWKFFPRSEIRLVFACTATHPIDWACRRGGRGSGIPYGVRHV